MIDIRLLPLPEQVRRIGRGQMHEAVGRQHRGLVSHDRDGGVRIALGQVV
jgi:hypothetical protein